jgi:hypothetical protein
LVYIFIISLISFIVKGLFKGLFEGNSNNKRLLVLAFYNPVLVKAIINNKEIIDNKEI